MSTEEMSPDPWLTKQQMIEVDRAMVDDYHIELIQMMENAGRNLAHLARSRFLNGDPVGKQVIILAGSGGNGGGALVCARRLYNWGAHVSVFVTASPEKLTKATAHQFDILGRMGVPVAVSDDAADRLKSAQNTAIVIDGIIGYSLAGPPHGISARFVTWANAQAAPILALDVPSGVDADTGVAYTPAIRATATMTLALPKQGLRSAELRKLIGELYLADISVPPGLYSNSSIGIKVEPVFASDDIIRLW